MKRFIACCIALIIILSGLALFSASAQEADERKMAEQMRTIPFKQESVNDQSVYYVAFITVLAAGISVGIVFFIKKYLQKRGLMSGVKGSRICLIESKRISPKLTIHLIMIDEQNYLIAQSGEQLSIKRHSYPTIEE